MSQLGMETMPGPVQQILREFPFPVSCAILRGPSGQVVAQTGDRQTEYQWKSVTKLAASRVVMGALETGHLRADRDYGPLARQILTAWGNPVESTTKTPLTISHLLSHASGLPVDAASPYRFPSEIKTLNGVAEQSPRPALRTKIAVETRRVYSNLGYEVTGAILSQETGVSFSDWLEAMLIRPLGLSLRFGETRWENGEKIQPDGGNRPVSGGGELFSEGNAPVSGGGQSVVATEPRPSGEVSPQMDSPAWGITSNLENLIKFAQECINPQFLSPKWQQYWLTQCYPQLPGVVPGYGRQPDCAWGNGPEIKATKGTPPSKHWFAPAASPQTWGHFGQSGSFLWWDPHWQIGAVFLGAEKFGPYHQQHWATLNQAIWENHR